MDAKQQTKASGWHWTLSRTSLMTFESVHWFPFPFQSITRKKLAFYPITWNSFRLKNNPTTTLSLKMYKRFYLNLVLKASVPLEHFGWYFWFKPWSGTDFLYLFGIQCSEKVSHTCIRHKRGTNCGNKTLGPFQSKQNPHTITDLKRKFYSNLLLILHYI